MVSRGRHLRHSFSVTREEVEAFLGESDSAARWLGKYRGSEATFEKYSRGLCMFFKWLRQVKRVDLGPQEFLDVLAEKRASGKPSERMWGKNLVLEFSRDNPEFEGNAAGTHLISYFVPLKRFCADNEVELTSAKSPFGALRRKYGEPPFTVDFAKRVLGVLGQRERAICMCMLQSGQSVKQVVTDLSGQGERIMQEISSGKQRIRIDFPERKGNNFPYFTFISKDAVTEIRKWLPLREDILRKTGRKTGHLFITGKGQPLKPKWFVSRFHRMVRRHKLWTGPMTVRSHMFRKIFESEASPPDRGISKAYVTFMMGHCSGGGVVSKLDMPGGTYDNAPRIYLEVVEREYEKLEQYINIYTARQSRSEEELDLSDEDIKALMEMLREFKEGKWSFKEK